MKVHEVKLKISEALEARLKRCKDNGIKPMAILLEGLEHQLRVSEVQLANRELDTIANSIKKKVNENK